MTLPAVAPTEPVTAAAGETALDRLRYDLAFAAPELWLMHVEKRMEEVMAEAAAHGAAAMKARIRHEFRDLPLIVAAIDGMGETE